MHPFQRSVDSSPDRFGGRDGCRVGNSANHRTAEGKWIDLREILAQVLVMRRRKPPAKEFTTLLSFFLCRFCPGRFVTVPVLSAVANNYNTCMYALCTCLLTISCLFPSLETRFH